MKKQNLLILFLFLTMPTLAQEQQPRKNDFGFSTRFFNSPATFGGGIIIVNGLAS
jgi:hypothetical protein